VIKLTDILKEILLEDRCKRIADRRYDKPSAYKSGAIVRCRKGNIWKNIKSEAFFINEDEDRIDYYIDKNGNTFQTINVNYLQYPGEVTVKYTDSDKPVEYKGNFGADLKSGIIKYLGSEIDEAFFIGEDDLEPLDEASEEFQNIALDKINKLGGFDKLPDIDKLALLGGSNDKKLELLNLKKIFQENGGTFGKFEIKVKVKDINQQPIEHKFSQEFAGKEGYLFPYIHYADSGEPYVTVRFDEFVSNLDNYGGGNYEERPIMLDNIYPIDYDEIKSDFVDYQNKIDFERGEFKKEFDIDLDETKKETLRTWFKRKGAPGKEGGWVDCNTCRDGKCKPCGRKEGEKRSKYPSCRPTPSQCKQPGKGKKWGKTK